MSKSKPFSKGNSLFNYLSSKWKRNHSKDIPLNEIDQKSDIDALWLPLLTNYRFIHEPMSPTHDWYIGRKEEKRVLAMRVLYSDGGAFLITGYRGVGKTSFVLQSLDFAQKIAPHTVKDLGPQRIVPVHLNLARELTAGELMHHIVRYTYQVLAEQNILQHLNKGHRQLIVNAFERTSYNVKQSRSKSVGSNLNISFPSYDMGALKINPFGYSRSRGQLTASEYSLLGYDDKSAEYDVIQILRQLRHGYKPAPWKPLTSIKMVFVLDELDKIELGVPPYEPSDIPGEEKNDQSGKAYHARRQNYLDNLLSTLKNLFTTSGATFIFVAGKEIHYRWQQDVDRGNSLYESVFAYEQYVPCLWEISDRLVNILLEKQDSSAESVNIAFARRLEGYLRYKSRGLPRRAFREINSLVDWNGQQFCLAISKQQLERITLFEGLEQLLSEPKNTHKLLAGILASTSPLNYVDEIKLCMYHIADIILGMGRRIFTSDEIYEYADGLISEQIIPQNKDSLRQLVYGVIDILVTSRWLEAVGITDDENMDMVTQIAAKSDEVLNRYRLERWVIQKLETVSTTSNKQSPIYIPAQLQNYESVKLLISSQYYDVYQAIHVPSGQAVSLKIVKKSSPEIARDIIQQEDKILRRLSLPGLPKVIDSLFTEEETYLATRFVDGEILDRLLQIKKVGLSSDKAVTICKELGSIVSNLHEEGIFRLDLKPSSILLTKEGGIRLIDIGTAIDSTSSSPERLAVWKSLKLGTRAYMAPELFNEPDRADKRADIYSFGVLLYELLTGSNGALRSTEDNATEFPQDSVFDKTGIDSDLWRILSKCRALELNQRYETMQEACEELEKWIRGERTVTPLPDVVGQAIKNILDADRIDRVTTMAGIQEIVNAPLMKALSLSKISSSNFSVASGKSDDLIAVVLERLDEVQTNIQNFRLNYGQKPASIGRSPYGDLVIDDERVSRFHATLRIQEDHKVILKDNSSDTGTFVNNERISETLLKNDDILRFGDHSFRVRFIFAGSSYANVFQSSPLPTLPDAQFLALEFPDKKFETGRRLTHVDMAFRGNSTSLNDVEKDNRALLSSKFEKLKEQFGERDIELSMAENTWELLCSPYWSEDRKNLDTIAAFDNLIEKPLNQKLEDGLFQVGDRIEIFRDLDLKIEFKKATGK